MIYIKDLRIATIIGVNESERDTAQEVSLDLEFATDITQGARRDRIEDADDYKAIKKRLVTFIAESKFQLVETLAERVAGIVLNEFGVPWLRLRLSKPGALSGAADVGVIIERGQKPINHQS